VRDRLASQCQMGDAYEGDDRNGRCALVVGGPRAWSPASLRYVILPKNGRLRGELAALSASAQRLEP